MNITSKQKVFNSIRLALVPLLLWVFLFAPKVVTKANTNYKVVIDSRDFMNAPLKGFVYIIENVDTHVITEVDMLNVEEKSLYLPQGSYVLREKEVPAGYVKSAQHISFSLPYFDGNKQVDILRIVPKHELAPIPPTTVPPTAPATTTTTTTKISTATASNKPTTTSVTTPAANITTVSAAKTTLKATTAVPAKTTTTTKTTRMTVRSRRNTRFVPPVTGENSSNAAVIWLLISSAVLLIGSLRIDRRYFFK